jgi:IS30 family transposase
MQGLWLPAFVPMSAALSCLDIDGNSIPVGWEAISRGMLAGQSVRSIAASLNRAPSTVCREIKRNGGQVKYRANLADQARGIAPVALKRCKLVEKRCLANIVGSKLQLQWSPEQIAGWLKQSFPGHEDYQVSHETTYRSPTFRPH